MFMMAMCLCTDYRVILLMFAGNFGRQEVRAVERRVLLETLASKLPPGTISFSSKLKSIAEQGPDGTLLELEDGQQILSKVSEEGPLSKLCFHSWSIQRAEIVNAAWILKVPC